MTLTAETGAGVSGANAYAAVATISAYWASQPHRAEAVAWAAATEANQTGASIEATAYLDATFGPYYRGVRRGYVQGLLFPRTGANDDAGYPLPDLPPELVSATCELSGRAVTAALSDDTEKPGRIKREMLKVGSFSEEFEYENGASRERKYGFVAGLLAPILNGSQPDAPGGNWAWA